MTPYPKTLPPHTKKVWQHKDCFHKNSPHELVYAYYHEIDDFPINMHTHNFVELNIITGGTGRHYIENQSFDISKGIVFIIPPDVSHGYWSDGDLEIFHIILNNIFFERYAKELDILNGYTLLFDIEPQLRAGSNLEFFLKLDEEQQKAAKAQFDALAAYQRSSYPGIETMKTGLTLHLIGWMSKQMAATHRHIHTVTVGSNATCILSSMEYIAKNFAEKLTIEKLSAIANMSRSSYLRNFEDICKCSPTQYIHTCRLKHASVLLTATETPIVDIANECGYFDSSHFIRHFTRKYGTTPIEYRRSHLRANGMTDDPITDTNGET